MPQSLSKVYLHVVYSTKDRRPFLQDKQIRQRAHAYLAAACDRLECPKIKIGGVEDHVHILCHLSRNISIADLVREIKRESSKAIKEMGAGLDKFQWQRGYGAFSASPSHVAPLKTYIANQASHHQRESFQDEFRRLLRKYDVDYDERYVWDRWRDYDLSPAPNLWGGHRGRGNIPSPRSGHTR
ncbi:MAG: IS200/IS605 family transposase [Planctomycetales bacterium]